MKTPLILHMTIACSQCGTLEDLPSLPRGAAAVCSVCENPLERTNGRSLAGAFACSLGTLLLLLPGNLLPLMRVSMLGMVRESRVGSGVIDLWNDQWVLVAVLVALFAVVAHRCTSCSIPRFHIEGVHAAPADWTALMNRTLAVLVQHELRARLAQSPPFIGGRHVELAMVPGAPAAVLARAGAELEIPAAESGGLEAVARELGQLPIAEIGDNVRAASAQLNRLLGSPQLRASIDHLNRALATLDATLRDAGPQVAPTLQSVRVTVQGLRETARELDAAVAGAQKVMGESALSPSGNLRQAMSELTEAARAVRTLAVYIDEHPESLLRGR